jgi:DNA-binding CsgD family transcriptional regulator
VASDRAAALIACERDRLVALDDCATHLLARLGRQDTPAGSEFATWLRDARAGDVALEDPLPDRHHTTWTDDLGTLVIRHLPGPEGRDLLVVRDLNPDLTAVLRSLGLRPREAAVLELVMTGHNNHQIAQQLEITQATVKKHLENIYRTLDVSTRTAAAAAGFEAMGNTRNVDAPETLQQR